MCVCEYSKVDFGPEIMATTTVFSYASSIVNYNSLIPQMANTSKNMSLLLDHNWTSSHDAHKYHLNQMCKWVTVCSVSHHEEDWLVEDLEEVRCVGGD